MRDIYRRAEEVAIWLGEEQILEPLVTQNGPFYFPGYALECIPVLARKVKSEGWVSDPDGMRADLFKSEFLPVIRGIHEIFEHPWWTRIWIKQEVAVLRKATIYHGKFHADFEHFLDFGWSIRKMRASAYLHEKYGLKERENLLLRCMINAAGKAFRLGGMRLLYRDQTPADLALILESVDQAYSSDPRDQIYALIGLTNPVTILQANYRQSVWDTYISAFSHLLKEQGNLNSLRFISGIPIADRMDGLPTWVPEFGRNTDVAFHSVLKLGTIGLYSATGSDFCSATIQFLEDGRVLKLRGIFVDVIQAIGEGALEQFSGSLGSVIINWKAIADLSNDKRRENFWRTVFLSLMTRDFEAEDYESDLFTMSRRLAKGESFPVPQSPDEEEKMINTLDNSPTAHHTRRFSLSHTGSMGLVPNGAQVGDVIVVLLGGQVPYILRPLSPEYYTFIGDCYIEGMMDGEIIEAEKAGKFNYEDFHLR